MFSKLQTVVNHNTGEQGGKALLQWYEATCKSERSESDCKSDCTLKTKWEKREISQKPLILVIATPLMARAHCKIQQASECCAAGIHDR